MTSPHPARQARATTLAMAAVAALTLTSCSTDRPTGGSASSALRIVGPFELHSLEPASSDGFFTRLDVAETLVDTDVDGNLVPELATRWTSSDDLRTWRFELEEGVRFHDGTDLTAEVVAEALERARSEAASPLATAPVTTVEAVGGAVEIELSKPFAPLPAVLSDTSTQVLARSSYDDDGAVTEVVGTGPYRVVDVELPAHVEATAFEQWRGTAPEVRDVTYEAVGRAESRALMARSGQADVVLGLDPVSRQQVESADGVELISATLPRTILMKVNAGHPVLGDVRVRRALSLALDRTAIATALLRDEKMAATQMFPPSLPEWHSADVTPLEHDATQARALLAEAGWQPDADGMLQRDGEPLRLTLRTYPDRPELPLIATAIQDAVRQVGVDLKVAVGNSSEISAGHEDGTLELALYARSFTLVPDPLATLLEDFGPGGADFGPMGWEDPALRTALDDLADGAPEKQAARRRAEVAELLQTELPLLPVAWYRQSAAISDRLSGFDIDPLERSFLIADMGWSV